MFPTKLIDDKNETEVVQIETNYAALGCNKRPTFKDTDGNGNIDTLDKGDCLVVGFVWGWKHPQYSR